MRVFHTFHPVPLVVNALIDSAEASRNVKRLLRRINSTRRNTDRLRNETVRNIYNQFTRFPFFVFVVFNLFETFHLAYVSMLYVYTIKRRFTRWNGHTEATDESSPRTLKR